MVEIQGPDDKALRWYREGMHQIADCRPDWH